MSKSSPRSPGEPWVIGCRMQMLLLVTFVGLFLAACWLVGTIVAPSP
jgi:hypothetical protein